MKKSLFIIATVIILASCSKPGTVEGVVTYFFNKYQGDKPDIGATVYATQADTDDIEAFLSADINNDLIESTESGIQTRTEAIATYSDLLKSPYATDSKKVEYQDYIDTYIADISSSRELLKTLTKLPMAELDSLEARAYRQFTAIGYDLDKPTASVDGSGRYSLTLPRGHYSLIFISKGRDKSNLLELQGRVLVESVEVKRGAIREVSVNFNL